MEEKYMLRMREWENNFYEDQMNTRKQWCSGKEEKRSKRTDERFNKDIQLKQKQEKNRCVILNIL